MHLKDDELVAALGEHADVPVLLAAVYARVTTAVSFTRMLTPLGNYFIARPVARAAAHHITEETDMPLDAAVVLGLSSDALHIWSADPARGQATALTPTTAALRFSSSVRNGPAWAGGMPAMPASPRVAST